MKVFRGHGLALAALVAALTAPGLATAQTCNLGATPCAAACSGTPCGGSVSVTTSTGDVCATGHSFNLVGTAYEDTCLGGIVGTCATSCPNAAAIPPIRFWGFDSYAKANSGCADKCVGQWIVNAKIDFGIGPANGHWMLVGADWQNPKVDGCVLGAGSPPTVLEISDVTGTGTVGHGAWYVINSAPVGGGLYNFDQVTGAGAGTGNCGTKDFGTNPVSNVTLPARAQACTGAPATVTNIGTSNTNASFFDVQVAFTVADPVWNTQGGLRGTPTLIAGYQIVYAKGTTAAPAEPTTSNYFTGNWQPALDPANPTMAAAVFPIPAATPVTVSLPKGTAGTDIYWLATRIVYADASLNPAGPFDPTSAGAGPDVVSPIGGHCGPVTFGGIPPNAVEFADLTATRNGNTVNVTWRTLYEDDVLGFRVFRASSPSGGDAEALPRLVTAAGVPSSYASSDSAAPTGTTWYYVQELTSNGPGMRSEAIRVDAQVGPAGRNTGGRSRGRR